MSSGQHDPKLLLRVLDVARELAAPMDLYDLLEKIVQAGRAILRADRGTVLLYDAQQRELYSTVGERPFRFSIDTGISGAAAAQRRTEFVPDCRADLRFNDEVDRDMGYETRSLLAVPLIGLDDELVGVMTMLNPPQDQPWTKEDLALAETLASQAAVGIQRSHLLAERDEKRQMEHEMLIAREIQAGIMPGTLPTCGGYDIAAAAHPAGHTGGDIYDVIELDDGSGCLALLLADATGHGIGPALMVTQLRSMVRMGLRMGADLPALLSHINRQLTDDLVASRFITAFLGVLSPDNNQLDYFAPGQGPILHFCANDSTCASFAASSMPLGIDRDAPQGAVPIVFEPGDALVLLTDGLFESMNDRDEQFGQARVEQVIRACHVRGAQAIVDGMLDAVHAFSCAEQSDDLTALVVLRR